MRKRLSLFKRSFIRRSGCIWHPNSSYRRWLKKKNAQRQIYIDCGANTGQVLRAHLSKHKKSQCFIFEPQPELESVLMDLINQYSDRSITYYKQAVWVRDEVLSFFLATQWGENHKGGSTLLQQHTNNLSKVDYSHPVQVQAIDFDQWFRSKVQPSHSDYIILKMDIEGAEYEVIEKMIASKSIDYISELIVEFHHQMIEGLPEDRHRRLLDDLKNRDHIKLVLWH